MQIVKKQAIWLGMCYVNRGVLVCTDIMGRGIDMPDIDWVIQFDAPTTARSVTAE